GAGAALRVRARVPLSAAGTGRDTAAGGPGLRRRKDAHHHRGDPRKRWVRSRSRRAGLRRPQRAALLQLAQPHGPVAGGPRQRRVRRRRHRDRCVRAGLDGLRRYGRGAGPGATDRCRDHRRAAGGSLRRRDSPLGTVVARNGGERVMTAIESRRVAGPLIKLVIFAVITIIVTGVLGQTLGSLPFGGGPRYRARFTDVTGVLSGDDVRIAGVRVGQVTRVSLVDNDTAELTFSVVAATLQKAGVHATIRYR